LGLSLDRIVRHLGGPSASSVATLFQEWDAIVGAPLCDHTKPLSLTDGCLTIAVDDPAWASQLRFLERELRGQVNDRLGPTAVDEVVFRVRPENDSAADPTQGL
jgi:predicted nucleic acid-binding Zn ribbon protein